MDNRYLTLDETHELLLKMLELIDGICRKEGITYFLSGGTLLGAIRHKGFIPWDDDIDLMMPRYALERFWEAAPRHLNDRYELAFPGKTRNYAMPWLRVYDRRTIAEDPGVVKAHTDSLFIDIFPIDGLPTAKWLSNLYFKDIRARDIMLKSARRNSFLPGERLQWLKMPLMKIAAIMPIEHFASGLYRAAGRIPFDKARFAGVCVVTHYGSRERMPAEVFRGSESVSFCGGEYPAPIGWDTYLTNLYGDYMEMPSEGKRHSKHRLRVSLVD